MFADDDFQRAQEGAGFLAVYSPDESVTRKIQGLFTGFEPRAVHWYQAGGVQSLI